MERNRIDELVAKYNEGLADPSEVKLLEQLIEEGTLELTQLHELASFDEQLMKNEGPLPSMRVNDQFYSMLAEEKRKIKKGFFSFHFTEWNVFLPRVAFTVALIVVGFAGGYLLQRPAGGDVQQLTQQVGELKEMMMLSLLEKESASERLRAVSLTNDMNEVSEKVTAALFQTLNHDPNVNVRLAALEALKPYVRQSDVREGMIRSISQQDSPLVQIMLAEVMVAIQEKKSVGELQKILDNDRTPTDVKSKIKKSIEVLT